MFNITGLFDPVRERAEAAAAAVTTELKKIEGEVAAGVAKIEEEANKVVGEVKDAVDAAEAKAKGAVKAVEEEAQELLGEKSTDAPSTDTGGAPGDTDE